MFEILQTFTKARKILVVGPMPIDREEQLAAFAESPYPILFIDGGNAHHHYFEGGPTLSIGDGDSFFGPLDITLPGKKDISDLKAGLDLLSSQVEEIYFFGLCGGRKDHELINLGEIYHFLKRQEGPCQAYFDKNYHALQKGTYQLCYKGVFSLLAFQPTYVSLEGKVEYAIPTPMLLREFSSLGLSNHALGTFTLTCDLPIFLLLPEGIIWSC